MQQNIHLSGRIISDFRGGRHLASHKLLRAREYEEKTAKLIPDASRPKFHLSPCVGWMNDPNGFSWYKGEYHLFYQYNPYDTVWDSMHWGHAVSKDLLNWRYLPAALAPDESYDSFGCFSGCAVELPTGEHLLMYTGSRKDGNTGEEIQTQCIAVGDGLNYKKYARNPVLDENILPEGLSRSNFRDPKIWREKDGSYRCVVSTCGQDNLGTILLFSSKDGFEWKYESVLVKNDGRFGLMWECPDFFILDGKHVLITNPMDMIPDGYEYNNRNGTVCLIGELDDEGKHFSYAYHHSVDYGIDFYAPQTILAPDGRRIMTGWMQNWDNSRLIDRKGRQWFGQMSLPRELSVRNNRLYQQPVRELEQYRTNKVEYRHVFVEGELFLKGIEGRTADLEITIRPADTERLYRKFEVNFAQDGQYRTVLSFCPHESVLKMDLSFSGLDKVCVSQCQCKVSDRNGELKLRIILDRFSAEVFINDGEQAMSVAVLTDVSAEKISFNAVGEAIMDIIKYDL